VNVNATAARYLFDTSSKLCNKFREDGYLILAGAVEAELVDAVRWEVEERIIAPNDDQKPGLPGFEIKTGRFQDAWRICPAVSKLAVHVPIQHALRELYGREPHPFQTLTFSVGTQQLSHSDHIHFSSRPLGFMCGVWVALEDVTVDNGPLFYYPGSQNLPYMGYSELGIDLSVLESEAHGYLQYEQQIEKLARTHGFERKVFTAKKGDALIWAANLIHGGSPVNDPGSSRWSQVTHYLFEDCLHYTPRLSDEVRGNFYVRRPINVATGELIPSVEIVETEPTSDSVVISPIEPVRDDQIEKELSELRSQKDSLQKEIRALKDTKTFRYTRGAREIYSKVRARFR